ncbi:MAG: LuxR C-terminal-related transcriptional regulator [Firmicutes bacterium]|nr:LuxR C-terminal-related transcriptional regulator [Bacillota bacterium]
MEVRQALKNKNTSKKTQTNYIHKLSSVARFAAAAAFAFAVVILAVCMLFKTSQLAYADGADGLFASGDGSAHNPYLITTPVHLDNMRLRQGIKTEPNHFALGADIDLKDALDLNGVLYRDGQGWLPVGQGLTEEDRFHGYVDGRGFQISSLWLNRPDAEYAGLFGIALDTTVVNLSISLASDGITGGAYVGGLIGFLNSTDHANIQNTKTSVIARSSVSGNIRTSAADGFLQGAVGGFMGSADNADVKESFFTGTLESGGFAAGGVAGFAQHTAVENCYIKAEIQTDGAAGGIFGYGSLARISVPNEISSSYTELKNDAELDAFIGASVPQNSRVIFSYGVGHGKIMPTDKYSAENVSMLDTAQLKTQTAYAGFDFINTWGIYENIGTPYLKNIANVVLIVPTGKSYDGTADFDPQIVFLGDYIENKPIFAEATAHGDDFINAGLYDAEIVYETAFVYQIFVAPYEISKVLLTLRAVNAAVGYAKPLPNFYYTVTGFINNSEAETEGIIEGLENLAFNVQASTKTRRLKRGSYVIEIIGIDKLSALNYDFTQENGVLTVSGLHYYEMVLIAAALAAAAVLLALVIYLTAVKKKTPADFGRMIKRLFVKEKTVVIKVSAKGKPLPTDVFTEREKEVADLLLLGKSCGEIAHKLYISENTARTHMQHVFQKTNVKSQKAFMIKYMLEENESSAKN